MRSTTTRYPTATARWSISEGGTIDSKSYEYGWRDPTSSKGGKSNPTNSRGWNQSHHIYKSQKKRNHTNQNDANANFTGILIDVAPTPHWYPTWRKFIESANHISTVTLDAISYPRKLLINYVIHPETLFEKDYRHLYKGDKKIVWNK